MSGAAVFYVYVLFDHCGIPRYIGKGKDKRWLAHEKRSKYNHRLKNHFIQTTLKAIGCIPKVKLRENISETEAFETEAAFIRAIGRYPVGPLVNLTDKRNGPSSDRIKKWHAGRTAEERSQSIRKGLATISPKALSEKCRANALSVGREELSKRMKAMRAKQTPERRLEIAMLAVAGRAAKRKERLLYKQPFIFDER